MQREREPPIEFQREEEKEIKNTVQELNRIFGDLVRQDITRPGIYKPREVEFIETLEKKVLPEILPEKLEKVIDNFLEKYRWIERDFERGHFLGSFISHLINQTVERYKKKELERGTKMEEIKPLEIKIDLRGINEIHNLGYKNEKFAELIISNPPSPMDAFKFTGNEMRDGKIIIKGNAGHGVGYEMKRGEIIIKGNAGDWIGSKMKGGKIIIEGNAGNLIGHRMTNGEIIIRGNAETLIALAMQGGEITIGGEGGLFTAENMKGGILKIGGNTFFHLSAFSQENRGRIFLGERQIWPRE